MNEEKYVDSSLDEMKRRLELERIRYGYSIDDPVEPITDKSGVGRMVFSVLFVAVLVAVGIIAVSVVALMNSGLAFEIPFIKYLNFF